MVFCNLEGQKIYNDYITVTILILIDGFLQYSFGYNSSFQDYVTILILIDGFLQYRKPATGHLQQASQSLF